MRTCLLCVLLAVVLSFGERLLIGLFRFVLPLQRVWLVPAPRASLGHGRGHALAEGQVCARHFAQRMPAGLRDAAPVGTLARGPVPLTLVLPSI